jgi:hypothetical protein
VDSAGIDIMFEYAEKNGFRELFILDPTFNIQPKFDNLLDQMILLNQSNRFEVSTELRADYLSDSQIEKLVSLNLVEAEIGLQSTNDTALNCMGRSLRTTETIERSQKMLDAGIKCKVDLIIGLPGDTLEGFKQSVDDVVAAGISDNVQVFRLSVLSGTEFSYNRDTLGLKVQSTPPYYLESTPTFFLDDIYAALDYAEEVFETTLYPIAPYLLSKDFSTLSSNCFVEFDSEIKPIHKVVISTPSFSKQKLLAGEIFLSENLVVHFIVSDLGEWGDSIFDLVKALVEKFKYSYFQFVVEFSNDVDIVLMENIRGYLNQYVEDSYLNRDAVSNIGVDLKLSHRLCAIAPIEFSKSEFPFDSFFKLEHLDQLLITPELLDENLYITGGEQQNIYNYLSENKSLDDFTIFEDYSLELLKDGVETKIYSPNQLVLE